MEMIQQKLAWALAMTALLILVYKLDLQRTGVSRSAIRKVKAGLILNLVGAAAGVALRIGITSGTFPHSTLVVTIETLGGYVLGWTLVIWGLIQGLASFFDSKGHLKTDLAVGKLSKIMSSALFNGSGPNRIIEELADDLLKVLSADAVTLHRVDEAGQLRLSYSVGLIPDSRNLIRMPEKTENMYHTCMASGRPVIADNPFEMMLGRRLELSKGLARSALCLPTSFIGRVHGLVTVYRTDAVVFSDEDCEILRIAGDGLGLALWRQYSDDADRIETRYSEAVSLARRYFFTEKSLVSAMIKTAKLIHGHIPFEKISLDIAGNGKPQSLDFSLSTGGVVSVGSGYFTRMDRRRTRLGAESSPDSEQESDIASQRPGGNAHRFPVYDGSDQIAELTIEMASTTFESQCLSMLGSALCREIAEFLRRERLAASADRTGQRLGAIQFLMERAESEGNLSRFLDNVANAVVDLMPAAVCRIVFFDDKQGSLRPAALAQARNLQWPNPDVTGLRSDDVDFCRRAHHSGSIVNFDTDAAISAESFQPDSRLMPPGVRRGMCLPLTMGERTIGLLIVGDSRRASRSDTAAEDTLFVSAVARLVSTVLTVHKAEQMRGRQISGMAKLTLKKKETIQELAEIPAALSSRSRINGPLAGILASCEYLQSCPPGDVSEISRFIEIIQRNAARIHSLTSETSRT